MADQPVTFGQVQALIGELEAQYTGTRSLTDLEAAGGDTNSCHSCINCKPEEQ